MARTSFAATISELYGLLAADALGTPKSSLQAAGVIAVYDHEPKPGDALRNCFVTIAPAGMTPDAWLIAQRVYCTWDESAKVAQDTALTVMVAVDDLMTDGFGPSQWEWSAVPEIGAFVATNVLMVTRADLSS